MSDVERFKTNIFDFIDKRINISIEKIFEKKFEELSRNEIKKIMEVYDEIIERKIARIVQQHLNSISAYLEENEENDKNAKTDWYWWIL